MKQGTDLGVADPAMAMRYMMVAFKPTSRQQAELEQLIAGQQNPSSPNYRKWLTPDEFGNRFGLSPSDEAKVSDWLTSQGLTVERHARGKNSIAFSGTVEKVSRALQTSIHKISVNGEQHFANISDPAIPAALADVVQGFVGLHDFRPKSGARVLPSYTSTSGSRYLAPADYATVYNINPLYQAGYDGTGQSLVVVGQSDILLSDLQAFKTRFGLPANDPKLVNYDGVSPGFVSGSAEEANLDLEWAGAIAPKATIYYVYGQDAFTATEYAIDVNVAPVISISYIGCESFNLDGAPIFRAYAQQASAQGITIVAATGDVGAAGHACDGGASYAAHGLDVGIPSSFPEVTAMGGTQFSNFSATYWTAKNTTTGGSALSYIPESAWDETEAAFGLLGGGGGASKIYAKPGWQQGPGVPADGRRDVPDLSLPASCLHGPVLYIFQGTLSPICGTSAAAPPMSGIVALLNQYQVKAGALTKAGLGNINPQLYRMAQTAPAVFHDITTGSNSVPCLLGTQDCFNGSLGYLATVGYDLATGIGSLDVNALVTGWNTAVSGAKVTLAVDSARVNVNSTVTATATVTVTTGTPTGTVDFNVSGQTLGTVALTPSGTGTATATLKFPVYLLGTGTFTLAATYSGDTSFSSGGAFTALRVSAQAGASSIVVGANNAVYPGVPDSQGLSWSNTITLFEFGGAVPSLLTGFTIDGQSQPLAQYFPSLNIQAGGSLSVTVAFYNLPAPVTKTFGFTGIDFAGNVWSRTVSINYVGGEGLIDFSMKASSTTLTRNDSAPGCSYSTNLTLTDIVGAPSSIVGLQVGGLNLSQKIPAIFGTTQLGAFGSVTGTICIGPVAAPATQTISISAFYASFGATISHDVTVSLNGPTTPLSSITPSVSSLTLTAADGTKPATQTISLTVGANQPWLLTLEPNSRTGAWLTATPTSGIGPATIAVMANGSGYGVGAYSGQLIFSSPNSIPQSVMIPVVFTLGGNTAGTRISSVLNAASFTPTLSPGSLAAIAGDNLSTSSPAVVMSNYALPNTVGGVFVTVNGYPAPIMFISPTQINVQIPYEVGAGPAVVGINNNGSVASFAVNIAPAAPGIFSDAAGSLVPSSTVKYGLATKLYVTGTGDTGSIGTGIAPDPSFFFLPQPLLPLTVTVAGTPVFVDSAITNISEVGITEVNIMIPTWVPSGKQPVIVWVNNVPSAPVYIQLN